MIFDIKLTSACDSRCSNCLMWESERKHISSYSLLSILNEFKNDEFIFSGGEPLLHPDIYAFISFAARNNINFLVLSNGVSYERVEEAIGYGARRITLSVDGFNHDSLRGVQGNLATIERILKCLSSKADFRLAYTVSKANNLEEDVKLLDKLIDLGADKSVYFAIAQQVKSFNVKEKQQVETLKIPSYYKLHRYSCMSPTTVKYLSRYPKPIRHCYSPQFYISIYEDGNVRYCQSYDFDIILGNIYETKLSEILASSEWLRKQSDDCFLKNKCWLACHRRWDVKTINELREWRGK